MNVTTATNPGWKTSEFWGVAVTSIVILLNSAFGWNIDPASLATVAGMVAAYVISRMGTKRAILSPGVTATATVKS